MSIKENTLPVATSLQEGDKVRIVNKDGKSKQIDAGAIGGGGSGNVFKVTITVTEDDGDYTYSSDKTAFEIIDAINSGSFVYLIYRGKQGFITASDSTRVDFSIVNHVFNGENITEIMNEVFRFAITGQTTWSLNYFYSQATLS